MNREGYKDPTAEQAIRNVMREGRRQKHVNNSFGRCRSCGRQVIWIRTTAGKNMPVNPGAVFYKRPEQGRPGDERLVLPNGEVVSAYRASSHKADGIGYVSHFATCPNTDKHRKG